ncbi:hypothetical protein FA13DRAFT_1868483 [Coprinellus micaceus]|uniref:Uncharacterized protein n=1 Tax=Coprinellus micaceus TaxID=71717 RepID=A0A4Y7TV95_COPMI|nr:hypothetical protein FA13DRAFT_1868483 [Coprinellus micaceus]
MAAFHSFRTIALVYIVVHSLSAFVHPACAAPFLPSASSPGPLSLGTSLDLPLLPNNTLLSPSARLLLQHSPQPPSHSHTLTKREKFTLQTLPNGELVAFSDTTLQVIPQGPASDGAGKDFDAPAILWMGYCFVIGTPMALGGVRLGRVATGVGVGGTAAMLAWASLINSLGPDGLADLVILLVVFGFFVAGFVLGLFKWGMYLGQILIGVTGGLSIGIRIMLFKEGLLISDMAFYAANWAVIAVLGAIGGATVVVKRWQRWGVAGGCASIGTFLVFLGVDLAMNRQSGMSRGLRFLFDRNSNHIVDIITTGYIPPISTQILLGASLGTTLLFAWAQHHFFRAHPFLPNRPEPRYTDPTMGRYTAEPESIYMENSTADLLAAPLPPSTSQSTTGQGSRAHRTAESLGRMRSSVVGWLGIGNSFNDDSNSAGVGRPRGGAAVVYQGHAMRNVEGRKGHGNVLGKIRPLRKDS